MLVTRILNCFCFLSVATCGIANACNVDLSCTGFSTSQNLRQVVVIGNQVVEVKPNQELYPVLGCEVGQVSQGRSSLENQIVGLSSPNPVDPTAYRFLRGEVTCEDKNGQYVSRNWELQIGNQEYQGDPSVAFESLKCVGRAVGLRKADSVETQTCADLYRRL